MRWPGLLLLLCPALLWADPPVSIDDVFCASCHIEFTVGSTRPELRVDVCSNCHPFFTGKQKLVDTEGRIDRFRKKYAHLNK